MASPTHTHRRITFKTPVKASSDSDLEKLSKRLAQESKVKRDEETRRGLFGLRHEWRCARARFVARGGLLNSRRRLSAKRVPRRMKSTPKFPWRASEEPLLTGRPAKRTKTQHCQAKDAPQATVTQSAADQDPISEYDSSSSEVSWTEHVLEEDSAIVPNYCICEGCGRRWDGLAQCMCDYDTDDESDDDSNKEN